MTPRPVVRKYATPPLHPNQHVRYPWVFVPGKTTFFPWGVRLTTCIAAICLDTKDERHKLILCSDWDVDDSSTGIRSEQAMLKTLPVGCGWYAMMGGSLSPAYRLFYKYRARIEDLVNTSRLDNVVERFSSPAHELRSLMLDDLCMSLAGVKYREALKITTPASHPNLHYQIASSEIGAELLLCGFVERTPTILMVDRSATVHLMRPWAVIGCGSTLASPSLMLRDYQENFFLEDAVYLVYEAKKRSERVSGVGDTTSLYVMEQDDLGAVHVRFMGPEGIQYLERTHWRYNPDPQYEAGAIPPTFWHEA